MNASLSYRFWFSAVLVWVFSLNSALADDSSKTNFELVTKQITFGPKHHFFGYIGHARTIPWNKSGKYILSLRTYFQDRMPQRDEAAEIVLLDTTDHYRPKQIEKTRAWNFQQGTMMYWNPVDPENQFFFNDRDPETNEVFAVLYDISKASNGKRVAEFRFKDTPIGNSGVSPVGNYFLGINYGRLFRTRPVTGYPMAHDWTNGGKSNNPPNDGIFKVNFATKEKLLLVSFEQLADVLRSKYPGIDDQELFINHTLWNPDGTKLLFFARADFDTKGKKRVNELFTMNADGTEMNRMELELGGHIEWDSPTRLIGSNGKKQVIVDLELGKIVETLGDPTIFPTPKGDIAVSPDKKWFVNGHSDKNKNFYTVLRRADNAWSRTEPLDRGKFTGGELRIDTAPAWNRDSTQLIGYGLSPDDKTRQMFLIELKVDPMRK